MLSTFMLITHEKEQNNSISELRNQLNSLSLQLYEQENNNDAREFTEHVSGESYDYLAIGNSITCHAICEYWWGEWGMAASMREKDYYHKVLDGLRSEYGPVNACAYSFIPWELNSHDRSETYSLLDPYLASGIDLVTIQLSENCSDISTFKEDLRGLIAYCKTKAGKECRILIIDDFWSKEKHQLKADICEEMEIDFVDLSDIRDNEEYMIGMGSAVQGDDGETHIIEHDGVSIHPGDKGMSCIAERVLAKVLTYYD